MGKRMAGRRVVVACANDFMGPAVSEVFREEGAAVIADTRDLRPVDAAAALIREAGRVDVLIVNLIAPDPRIIVEQDTTQELWQLTLDTGRPRERLLRRPDDTVRRRLDRMRRADRARLPSASSAPCARSG